ncbi:MAG TPA: ABC transporter permease [Bacillota bacterium]|jgi:ABC-2 type transport system permease protein
MGRYVRSARDAWRAFAPATWLGWQIDSNWTDLFTFSIYTLIKPMAGALIVVVMYLVGTRTSTRTDFFAQMYTGNAFYTYLGAIIYGMSWVIHEDREHYEMIKYVYIGTVHLYWYLLGRAVAKFLVATLSVVILLAAGKLFLGLQLTPATVDWAYFLGAFLLGIAAATGLGLALAGAMMITARQAEMASEVVSGAFYLVCGFLFPIDVLPRWGQAIARWIPFTYWNEAIKRGLFGHGSNKALAAMSNGDVMTWLLVSTAVCAVLSFLAFFGAESLAKRRGLLDQLTSY